MSWFTHAWRIGFVVAGLCFLLLSAQFFRLALAVAQAEADAPAERAAVAAPGVASAIGDQLKALTRSAGNGVGRPPSGKLPLKALVYVSSEGPRAAVFLNGRRLGQTPFMGDFDCSPGDPVKIELLLPEGAPKRREVPCSPEMRVSFRE